MSHRNVLVLSGGLSPERDVSLRSGRRVADALRSARPEWEVLEADVDASLLPRLREHRPDCVVPLLHGAAGEDGALRDVLETLDIAFVGSEAAACRLAFDKPVASSLVSGTGVAVPEFVVLPQSTFRELGAPMVMEAVAERIGFPLVVKPTRGGSALGVSIVHRSQDLPPAMVSAFAYGDTAMIQRFVAGTEVAVSVIDSVDPDSDADGPRVLPVVEIEPEGEMYDYHARYTAGTTAFYCPARLDADVTAAVSEAAVTVHAALGLTDLSRTDLIVDGDGTVWFLEVNVAPGMTETSLMPQAIAQAGMDVGDVFAALIKD